MEILSIYLIQLVLIKVSMSCELGSSFDYALDPMHYKLHVNLKLPQKMLLNFNKILFN